MSAKMASDSGIKHDNMAEMNGNRYYDGASKSTGNVHDKWDLIADTERFSNGLGAIRTDYGKEETIYRPLNEDKPCVQQL